MNFVLIFIMSLVYFALFAITDAINKKGYRENPTHFMLAISTIVGMIYLLLIHNLG